MRGGATIQKKLLEYAVLASVGVAISVSFAHFGSSAKSDASGDATSESSVVEAFVEYNRMIIQTARRFWKIWAGLAIMLVMESMKEIEHHGLSGFTLARVLRLGSFRDTLRRLVRGQGLEPMPAEVRAPQSAASTTSDESQADEDAVAAAKYANERAALRRAQAALRRLNVDHIVYGVPGPLEAAMDDFERLTGIKPMIGGAHPGLGTHNAIVSLGGGAYFEILCCDPCQPDPPKLWMGMSSLEARCFEDRCFAKVMTWAVDRTGRLEEAIRAARASGYDPGDEEGFERQRPDGSAMKWSLSYRHYTVDEMGAGSGAVPFLIDWKGNTSPAATAPVGCELVGLRAEVKDYEQVANHLRALEIQPDDLMLTPGETDRLVAYLRTPKGVVSF